MIEIINQFDIQGEMRSYEVFGSGHIHDTYKLITTEKEYIFQKINL